jgi:hypothetical protein
MSSVWFEHYVFLAHVSDENIANHQKPFPVLLTYQNLNDPLHHVVRSDGEVLFSFWLAVFAILMIMHLHKPIMDCIKTKLIYRQSWKNREAVEL